MQRCDVRQATHVSVDGRTRERIATKWGIAPDGKLAAPSAGGFGCVTESGTSVDMWSAHSYWREEN